MGKKQKTGTSEVKKTGEKLEHPAKRLKQAILEYRSKYTKLVSSQSSTTLQKILHGNSRVNSNTKRVVALHADSTTIYSAPERVTSSTVERQREEQLAARSELQTQIDNYNGTDAERRSLTKLLTEKFSSSELKKVASGKTVASVKNKRASVDYKSSQFWDNLESSKKLNTTPGTVANSLPVSDFRLYPDRITPVEPTHSSFPVSTSSCSGTNNRSPRTFVQDSVITDTNDQSFAAVRSGRIVDTVVLRPKVKAGPTPSSSSRPVLISRDTVVSRGRVTDLK